MISHKRKINIAVILLLMIVNISFAYFYNAAVSKAVTEAAYADYANIQQQNIEIIEKLKSQNDISEWKEILDGYEEHIVIYDKNTKAVVQTESSAFAPLSVKVRTPFEFKGEAYFLRTSTFFLKDYTNGSKAMLRFIVIEFLIIATAVAIFILIIYSFMLRPFRVVYRAIEEYDRSGKLMDIKLKGYAGKVYRRFASMAKNVESQQQNERRIIASISHDIKTPLTSIMGYSEQLKKNTLSEERKGRYLDTVYEKALDIRAIVDEFDEYLGYNMPYEMKKSRLTVDELYEFLINDYCDDFALSDIDFEIKNTAEKTACIDVDINKLKRVFSNILSNSVKHFRDGEKKIRIDIFSSGEMVAIRFSDNGKGVDEDKYELIFEPLYTSDEGRKVAGLGLSICREITEAHDGRIYAEKSEMGGLAVTVELPEVEKE